MIKKEESEQNNIEIKNPNPWNYKEYKVKINNIRNNKDNTIFILEK